MRRTNREGTRRTSKQAVCSFKSATKKTVARTAVFSFLLPYIVHGPALTSASVYSENLQGLEEESLLFWAAFDFSVDAALQFLGPVDRFLRGADAPSGDCLDPHSSSPMACTSDHDTPFIDDLFASMDDLVSSLMKNLSSVLNGKKEDHDSGELVNISFPVGRGGARFGGARQSFSLYQPGDGSETDPDGIPTRYLVMQNGKREAAKNAVQSTLQWRKEHEIDHILTRPHQKFDQAKAVFPHFFLGRDKNGDIVFLQRPALIDLARAKKNGLSLKDLLMHYVFVNEYLWQILEKSKPLGTMTSIIDLTGLQFGVLRKRELIQFLKLTVSTMDSHFPQRAHKTLILNAPKWFNTVYKLFSPLMRESTKAKIEIHTRGRKQDDALKKYLNQQACENLPAGFWSKKKSDKKKKKGEHEVEEGENMSETQLEQEFRSFVLARLEDSGKKMNAVL